MIMNRTTTAASMTPSIAARSLRNAPRQSILPSEWRGSTKLPLASLESAPLDDSLTARLPLPTPWPETSTSSHPSSPELPVSLVVRHPRQVEAARLDASVRPAPHCLVECRSDAPVSDLEWSPAAERSAASALERCHHPRCQGGALHHLRRTAADRSAGSAWAHYHLPRCQAAEVEYPMGADQRDHPVQSAASAMALADPKSPEDLPHLPEEYEWAATAMDRVDPKSQAAAQEDNRSAASRSGHRASDRRQHRALDRSTHQQG